MIKQFPTSVFFPLNIPPNLELVACLFFFASPALCPKINYHISVSEHILVLPVPETCFFFFHYCEAIRFN